MSWRNTTRTSRHQRRKMCVRIRDRGLSIESPAFYRRATIVNLAIKLKERNGSILGNTMSSAWHVRVICSAPGPCLLCLVKHGSQHWRLYISYDWMIPDTNWQLVDVRQYCVETRPRICRKTDTVRRRRPKLRWMDCVNRNMRATGTVEDEVHDRTSWRIIVSAFGRFHDFDGNCQATFQLKSLC